MKVASALEGLNGMDPPERRVFPRLKPEGKYSPKGIHSSKRCANMGRCILFLSSGVQ